jgi:ABC-type lipoprotein release transport system permease subunit
MQNSISESLSELGGEIMIWDKGALVPFLSTIPENYTQNIEKIQYVKNVVPQITGISTVDSKDWRIVIGINPFDIPLLYTYTMVEGVMLGNNENKAVIGYLFADFIKKRVGDNVTIVYSASRQVLPIVGIFKTDTWMDNVVIVPFETAQNIFGLTGRASIIIVTVTDPSRVDFVIHEIRKEFREEVNAFKSQEATTRLAPIMNSVSWFSYVLFMISGAACFFGITNVTLTGILERAREIGILKALGAKGADVTRMIIYESALLGAFGGLLGCLISFGLLIQGLLIPITSASTLPISVFPEVFVNGLILSITISILASLYPIWKAIRVRPNEVLKFG